MKFNVFIRTADGANHSHNWTALRSTDCVMTAIDLYGVCKVTVVRA